MNTRTNLAIKQPAGVVHTTGITLAQRKFSLGAWWSLILAAGLVCGLRVGSAENESEWIKNSLVSAGDIARLEQVLAKARRGEPITIGVIGGSITEGARASKPEYRYASLVAGWWKKTFPHSKIKFINAGIGSTGSTYGALRAKRDLLDFHPDFVVVDFAVNDGLALKQAAAETLEGLIRQILSQANQPSVVLLFMMRNDGSNIQDWHAKVGAHYDLPMVSYRDALWPKIQAGHLQWEAVGADYIHPNDRGHAFAASCIISLLENTLQGLPADRQLPPIKPLPAHVFSDLFKRTALFEGEALRPVSNQGWTYDAKIKGWTSDQPGSVIDFEIEGRALYTLNYVVRGAMGKARVTVDGTAGKELNGWFDQTWGGYRQINEILRQTQSGNHRVRFELLKDKSPDSTGHRFVILGLGAAGLSSLSK